MRQGTGGRIRNFKFFSEKGVEEKKGVEKKRRD